MKETCPRMVQGYRKAKENANGYFERIGRAFSEVVHFNPLAFEPDLSIPKDIVPEHTKVSMSPVGESFLQHELLHETVARGACQLLSRLPNTQIEPPNAKTTKMVRFLPASYFCPRSSSTNVNAESKAISRPTDSSPAQSRSPLANERTPRPSQS